MSRLIRFAINAYQRFFKSQRLYPRCKYFPCCSDYTLLAVAEYGVLRGLLKSARRILRCNPFAKGGLDLP